MRHIEILVTGNGGDFEQKGREREENRWLLSVAIITDIEGKKISDELGFFLGVVSCELFSLWTENSKFKKIKLQA